LWGLLGRGRSAPTDSCGCGADDCPAAQQGGSRTDVVIHVIAEQDSLTDDTPVQLDGAQPQPVDDKPVREMTIGEALAPCQEPSAGPAHTTPATAPATATREPGRGLAMPRRTRTRAENRQRAIEAERRLNDAHVAERNKPPPF
jgi:hypothetical protein